MATSSGDETDRSPSFRAATKTLILREGSAAEHRGKYSTTPRLHNASDNLSQGFPYEVMHGVKKTAARRGPDRPPSALVRWRFHPTGMG